jgi:hypothetical protein
MYRTSNQLVFSATDLVDFSLCERRTQLELARASGLIERPLRDEQAADLSTASSGPRGIGEATFQALRDLVEINSIVMDALAVAAGETIDEEAPWARAPQKLASLGRALTAAAVEDSPVVVVRGGRGYEIRACQQRVGSIVRGESIDPFYNVSWNIWIGKRSWSIPNHATKFRTMATQADSVRLSVVQRAIAGAVALQQVLANG